MAATNTTSIAKDLNLCSVPETEEGFAAIMALINVVAYSIPLTSYNNPVANPIGASPQKLVNETLLLDDSTQIVNAILTAYYPPSLYPCIEWNTTDSDNPTLQKDSFNYLVCKYFPLSSNEVPNGTIFVPTSVQTESDPTTCKTLYDLVPPTQEYVEKKYHITRDELVNAKRILFAYNEMDPTTSVGIDPMPLTQDRNASRYMFTSLSAHGEEMIASYPGDKPSVLHARQVQLQTIKEWLGYQ
jgi:dipeptidyl-peptidase-2/lysosomal Pro-X carboxypeptidase